MTQTRVMQTRLPGTQAPELTERVGIVEAILFVTGDAVEKREICRAMEISEAQLDETLDALESGYDFERRGLRLLRFGTHVQLATRPDYAAYVEKLLQPVQKQSLSQAVMETLAVIAYRQPVTKAEIEQVRGVKCDYSVQALVTRGLIEEVGRKEALGRPILYGTTDAFLRHFCISSLSDLPEIDFSALAAKLDAAGTQAAQEASAAEQLRAGEAASWEDAADEREKGHSDVPLSGESVPGEDRPEDAPSS